jgi:hypothetical protein
MGEEYSGSFSFTVEDDEDVELLAALTDVEPVYVNGRPSIVREQNI